MYLFYSSYPSAAILDLQVTFLHYNKLWEGKDLGLFIFMQSMVAEGLVIGSVQCTFTE